MTAEMYNTRHLFDDGCYIFYWTSPILSQQKICYMRNFNAIVIADWADNVLVIDANITEKLSLVKKFFGYRSKKFGILRSFLGYDFLLPVTSYNTSISSPAPSSIDLPHEKLINKGISPVFFR